jgi:hypothetical protein
MKKIYLLLIISFSFFSCRKEINEPPVNTRNQNFVFMEINEEKFMIEDRSWNFNNNTKGSFEIDNNTINVRFLNDSLIETWFNARNTGKQNNRNFRYLSIGMNMRIEKKKGLAKVFSIGLNCRCYAENENIYYSFSINKDPYSSNLPNGNNSFKNCKFEIIDYDEQERKIKLNISGKVENEKENNQLVPIILSINLKNNSKF